WRSSIRGPAYRFSMVSQATRYFHSCCWGAESVGDAHPKENHEAKKQNKGKAYEQNHQDHDRSERRRAAADRSSERAVPTGQRHRPASATLECYGAREGRTSRQDSD